MAKRKRAQTSPSARPGTTPAANVSSGDARDVAAVPTPSRPVRILCLLVGLILPQLVLLGDSLWGGSILLPLDILAGENIYLPRPSPDAPWPQVKDSYLADLVLQAEPYRRLTAEQVRAGRLPLWNPFSYAGHPLLAANQPQVFSPYRVVDYLWPSPVALAWQMLLKSLVMGIGTYLLLRRAVKVHWFAAAVAAWASPLLGTMVLSGGYTGSAAVSFLPWVLLVADAIVARAQRRLPVATAVAGLGIVTAFTLLAGHAAFAGQVLLVGGVYFVWRVVSAFGIRSVAARSGRTAILAGAAGVLIGFLLSAPQTLPTVDYLRGSLRIAQRQASDETPPSGPSAVVQMVLPYVFGSTQQGSHYVGGAGNRIESAAGGYAGLLMALVLAPLGWAAASRRRSMSFWTVVLLLAVTPTVGIPVLSWLFAVPPVSLLRNNRLVFAGGFAIFVMASIGLDVLLTNRPALRRWPAMVATTVALLLLLVLAGWCLLGVSGTPLGDADGHSAAGPLDLLWPDRWGAAAGGNLMDWSGLMFRNGAAISLVAVAAVTAVLVAARRPNGRAAGAIAAVVGLLAIAEMVSASAGVNVRSDPTLYYPRLAWMDAIADKPGRVCGYKCFPANLSIVHGQRDIRGYDAADPTPIVELVLQARVPGAPVWPAWAVTQFLSVDPRHPSPAANLLGVRHIVGRGRPPEGVAAWWAQGDYWLAENAAALPRVTLPTAVRVVPDAAERLAVLGAPQHDPAAVTLLESPPPPGTLAAEGTATIIEDLPTRVRIRTDLSRGGVVRLADAWDAGWRVTYNGQPIDLLRADHALRAVVVPAGQGTIEFEYAPASFRWGLILGGVGVAGLAASTVVGRRAR